MDCCRRRHLSKQSLITLTTIEKLLLSPGRSGELGEKGSEKWSSYEYVGRVGSVILTAALAETNDSDREAAAEIIPVSGCNNHNLCKYLSPSPTCALCTECGLSGAERAIEKQTSRPFETELLGLTRVEEMVDDELSESSESFGVSSYGVFGSPLLLVDVVVEVVCGDIYPSELRVPPQAPGKVAGEEIVPQKQCLQRRKLCNSVGNFTAHLVVEKTEESKIFQLRKGFWDPPRNQIIGNIQALESSDVVELRRN
ncbi:hypothetical protein C1H46_000158 [Malus baccata]|uniref:Uncharacterized protein n=1 Tax=Malus baccata TaxID=106549 RepID=A0A540NTA1_MALBA|nr:hypothetical protein C1H46_000158 [Malus baccata]